MNSAKQWQWLELWERARDGRVTEAEARELNQLILDDPAARRLLAEAAWMDAELRLGGEMPEAAPASHQSAPMKRTRWIGYALTAAAAAVVAAGLVWMTEREPAPVAILAKANGCKWGNSALPTIEGAQLHPGTLELIEGLAKLRFTSGAEVTLEAPVSLEVLNNMECRVRKGTVVADVPPSAKGFAIYTPETKVVDYGTRFGVSASEDGKCLVHVLEGLVEVKRKGEPAVKQLRAGERADYGGWIQRALNPDDDSQPEPSRWLPGPISDLGDGWQLVTTAFGRGQDSWIQSNPSIKVTGKESFLRIKHTSLDTKLERKIYLAFDLTRFAGKRIVDAEFALHIEPSDLGYASLVPDATFSVYALIDEAQDIWDEAELKWANAPAQSPAAKHDAPPVASQSRLLGKFVVPQGTNRGAFTIKDDALVDFLRADTNGLVTLIVCRDTGETSRNGLAHAFASKENARNTPPLLKVRVE